MYPLTHLYITFNSAGNHPLLLFASTLPDLPMITKQVTWNNFRGIQHWYKTLADKELKVGLMMHSLADLVSHGIPNVPIEQKGGYVAGWILRRFPKLSYGGIGHQMAEAFLELYVAKQYPFVFGLLNESTRYAGRPEIATKIAAELSSGLHRNYDVMHKLIHKYVLFLHGLSIAARLGSRFGNPGQGREECLREAIAKCKGIF